MKKIIHTWRFIILVLSIGVFSPATRAADLPPAKSGNEQLEAGRKIYNFRCYFCHGYSGNAKTVAASFLNPKPVDFTRADPARITPEYVVSVLRNGKPGTAMQPFRSVLSDKDMELLAAFVVDEFVQRKAPNTYYHTPENGWPNHQRYQAAFPFATGEIPSNRPWEELSAEQARGKRLFLASCVICHDRGGHNEAAWEATPLSYPRNNYSPSAPPPTLDAMSSASPYLLHEVAPKIADLTEQERNGEKLFQGNCAFCHAADGTGKNWIGSFLQPHPRNLRDPAFMETMTRTRLSATIHEGLPGTSMPAWKSVLNEDEISAIVAYVAKAFHPLPD
ncbi:MAG: c-type cytochrome [Gammaproteobacteria bacterium]|nr:c-type cytochrome [Gammaproteobacteria bacterium]